MNLTRSIVLLTFICLLYPATPYTVRAQTPDQYIWYSLSPTNITTTTDLQMRLDQETSKLVSAGHLAPFRTLYGELIPHYSYIRPYETIYTLSLLYPYVSSIHQAQLKTFLTSELQTYPVWYANPSNWGAPIFDPQVGTKREPEAIPDDRRVTEFSAQRWTYKDLPRLFGLYTLWIYAQNTGDWQYIETNWSQINSFYTANRDEISQFYSSLAGAIGYARLAYQKPSPDQAAVNAATTDIANGLTAGTNFTQFGLNTENIYKNTLSLPYAISFTTMYFGYHFIDITPEIGRYFSDNPTLKAQVLGTSNPSKYSISQGEQLFPTWYLAQGPYFTEAYAEDSGLVPEVRAMLFPVKAWVQHDPTTMLRLYLDVPDALVGDYYYLQNLVRTIEASGDECWEDLRTTTIECPTTIPTPPPTSPTPATASYDLDGDRDVDLLDLLQLILGFNTNGPGNFNLVGLVDIFDFNTLIQNL